MARRMRFSDTGVGVPTVCANRLTRSSSIIQRTSVTAASSRRAGGSDARQASYSCSTACT